MLMWWFSFCPTPPETRWLIDTPQLALLRQGALLVNAARGPIVEYRCAG